MTARAALAQALGLSLLWGAAGCSEYALSTGPKSDDPGAVSIAVQPRSIDFLAAGADETVVDAFVVTNVGAARADLEPLALEATDSFSLLAPDWPDYLDPGEELRVEVAFRPEAAGSRTAVVQVRSNDDDEPEIPVDLVGMGLVPELRIQPEAHDFGDLPTGCEALLPLQLSNVGEAELTIEALSFVADPGLELIGAPTLPTRLAPGAATEAWVRFTPLAESAAGSTLSAESNDPGGLRIATQQGLGAGGEPRSESFTFDENPPVDLLFAIDQSCSMDDDAAAVAAELGPLITAIDAVTTGWQLGVITLDSGCINDTLFQADTPNLQARFTAAALLGEDRDISDDEALLKLSHRALAQTGAGGCNAGLVRSGAALHLIVVSDEPERSVQERATWTWDYWLAAIQGAAADASGVVISGIVDKDDCNDGDDGYAEAIAATGGAHLSLCSADWTGTAEALAEATVARAWTLPLAEVPLPGSVRVRIGGAESADWTWDAAANAVLLGSSPGADPVVVDYTVQRPCP